MRTLHYAGCLIFAVGFCLQNALAQDSDPAIQGLVEPYRTIDVASSESGRLDSMQVVVGQSVKKGETLAVLDDAIQKALVEIAVQQASAKGAIEAAKADRTLHETRIARLTQLVKEGYARPEELMRAKSDFSIASARVLQAEETRGISKAELARYQIQLSRRTILAPVDGIVSDVLRDPGEFVSPTEPYVARIIQTHPLIAIFNLPDIRQLKRGDALAVVLGAAQQRKQGVVESIAPLIDAESGTTQIRIRIENPDHQLRAGQKCWLEGYGPALIDEQFDQAIVPSRQYIMRRR